MGDWSAPPANLVHCEPDGDHPKNVTALAPLDDAPRSVLADIRAVASDIDGTLTSAGRLDPAALATISALAAADVRVVLVTGRSAGWAAGLAHYLPDVVGAVAENGAVVIGSHPGEPAPVLLEGSRFEGVGRAEACVAAVCARYPGVRPGSDNFARLSDRTVESHPELDVAGAAAIAEAHGCRHTYSSVHHHFTTAHLDKRSGLLAALEELGLLDVDLASGLATIGDSSNDGPLFDQATFALTVGVRGVTRYFARSDPDAPQYVTIADGGAGFVEFGRRLLGARG